MILTEDEAKDKICKVQPAAVVHQQGLTGKRGYCGLARKPRHYGPGKSDGADQ